MKPPATGLHQWWAIAAGSQSKWIARSRWSRSPALGLVPAGVASWAAVSGVTWPKANEPARTTTTTETRSDNRRIANLPWFVSGCHHGSRERASMLRAATTTGYGPGVPGHQRPRGDQRGPEQTGTHHTEGTWSVHRYEIPDFGRSAASGD